MVFAQWNNFFWDFQFYPILNCIFKLKKSFWNEMSFLGSRFCFVITRCSRHLKCHHKPLSIPCINDLICSYLCSNNSLIVVCKRISSVTNGKIAAWEARDLHTFVPKYSHNPDVFAFRSEVTPSLATDLNIKSQGLNPWTITLDAPTKSLFILTSQLQHLI